MGIPRQDNILEKGLSVPLIKYQYDSFGGIKLDSSIIEKKEEGETSRRKPTSILMNKWSSRFNTS